MDYDSIVDYVLHSYKAKDGVKLSEAHAIEFLRALLSVRDTEAVMHTAYKSLVNTILEYDKFYGKCVFACDLVQLRDILENKRIKSLNKTILFSQSACERIVRDQKILLKLNLDPCKTKQKCNIDSTVVGGLAIIHTNNLAIDDCIESIVVNTQDYNIVQAVESIVRDTETACEVYTSSYVHGLDKYKFASKFEINSDAFNLRKHIEVAKDAEEALNLALQRVWERHPDSATQSRPERYTAEFWMKSGFFDKMVKLVRKSDVHTYNLKVADASSGSSKGTGGRLSGEGTPAEYTGVKRMQYYSPHQTARVAVGDEYYVRQIGMLNSPKEREIYKIIKIDGDYVHLKPHKGRSKRVEIALLPMNYIKKTER